ncbi:MAG: AAA family ATPase, partial [Actinomycetes bacterium]
MLEIRLLGEQRVVDDESIVSAAQSPRVIGLLAQLALHAGEDVTRSRIAGLFWPDSTSEQALTNLRRELHQLRKALPGIDGCLVTDARTLRWVGDASCSFDVVTFLRQESMARGALRDADTATFVHAATQAVSSYGGAFLPASYDDWVLEERDRLQRLCVGLLTGLVDAERESDLGSATEHARRRVELEQLEEVGYRDLMELQAQAGDRAAALRTYHRCASILERELGVAPDPMTTALYDKLVAGTVGRGETAARAASDSQRSLRLPLIGRDQPLGELNARWAVAAQGRAGLHLLTGDSGVGKSRLVDELAVIADRGGASVARARCFAGRARLAMAPVAEWLASPELRAQRDHLDPVWAAEVDRLVPVAGASRTRPEPMVDAWQRHRFFEGLARAVLASERPTLLILDDLQWCDEDTLVWIQLLLRLGHQHPLLVLAATRTDDVDANEQLSEVLAALRHEDLMTSSELAPLDVESTIRLAELLGADGPEAESVHAATGGYPLFVIESARAGRASPGDTLVDHLPRAQEVLAGRLAQLSTDAHDVATLASVVGRDFSLELLAEASDLDADTVLNAVDELWR